MSDDNEGYDFTDDEGNDYDDKKNDDDKSKCGSRTTLDKPISVLEAKRVHKGSIKVIGKIVTTSEMYVLHIEAGPNAPVDRDARFIQLEDIEKLDENERLDVILYDDLIENVVAGEIVEIEGEIRVENKNNKNSKKNCGCTHAESIRYVNRKDLVITTKHIEAFEKFAKLDCEKITANRTYSND